MTYIIVLKVTKFDDDQLNTFEIFSKNLYGHLPHSDQMKANKKLMCYSTESADQMFFFLFEMFKYD